jgi:hypothetical protein
MNPPELSRPDKAATPAWADRPPTFLFSRGAAHTFVQWLMHVVTLSKAHLGHPPHLMIWNYDFRSID